MRSICWCQKREGRGSTRSGPCYPTADVVLSLTFKRRLSLHQHTVVPMAQHTTPAVLVVLVLIYCVGITQASQAAYYTGDRKLMTKMPLTRGLTSVITAQATGSGDARGSWFTYANDNTYTRANRYGATASADSNAMGISRNGGPAAASSSATAQATYIGGGR